MKLRKILAASMVLVMLVALAGCNYVSRPYGTANNSSDISSTLGELLEIPEFDYQKPDTQGDPIYIGPNNNDSNNDIDETPPEETPDEEVKGDGQPDDEEPPEETPVYTPFTSEFNIETLMSKIDALIETVRQVNGVANSATGVSDELLAGRTVKILVPDDFPIDDENEAVKAMVEQYGCAVNVRRVGTGSAYVAACRNAVLSGDKVDLMYVDNSIWGDIHTFTQPINALVNMDLADELGTFSSAYSEKFYTINAFDSSIDNYYVAAGIGAPYLLAYNKANIKNAVVAADSKQVTTGGVTETKTLREIQTVDPVEMYNNGTWGVNAFTAMLQASTSGANVGIASKIDALEGLDIWYGMMDQAGIQVNSNNGKSVDTATAADMVTLNTIQDWYWTLSGADNKNNVGIFEDAADWADSTVYQKLLNQYSGTDAVTSYSFLACEPEDLAALNKAAKGKNVDWDFVAYPYGDELEQNYRMMTEDEFDAQLKADEAGKTNADYDQKITTPVAGWVGGFAVMKTCQNPSVALRIAEEYTKIWKNDVEASYLKEMTEEQQIRYADMKENIGVSFMRALVEKAADVNATYPGYSEYIYGTSSNTGGVMVDNPTVVTTDRSNYLALSYFDNNALLAVHPMYHKDTANSIYKPEVHYDWEAWMLGALNPDSETKQDSSSVQVVLNAVTLPATVLFNW